MTQNWNQFIAQFPISNPSAKMLVDLSHFGIIKVSGADAAKFLQGQLTCDVLALQDGASTLGAYCNIKGKVTSLFRLWHQGDNFYLRMVNSLVDPTLQELKKYSIFSKVELQNVSPIMRGFGVSNHSVQIDITDPELAILSISNQKRYEIYGPTKSLEKAWRHCIEHANHVDPSIWEKLDIQDNIPELYPETVDKFFPHDLNLPNLNAVSFTKGCYRGQEIVARMQHRGNLKRHLRLFQVSDIEDHIDPGDLITAGGAEIEANAGTVVRSCRIAGDQILGLAVISDSHANEGLNWRNSSIILK